MKTRAGQREFDAHKSSLSCALLIETLGLGQCASNEHMLLISNSDIKTRVRQR